MHFNLCGCLLVLIFLNSHLTVGFPINNNNNDYNKPKEYPIHSPVPLKVNKITSSRTGVPHSYYSLPFCVPKETNPKAENIAEILSGDHIEDSLYEVCIYYYYYFTRFTSVYQIQKLFTRHYQLLFLYTFINIHKLIRSLVHSPLLNNYYLDTGTANNRVQDH